MDKDSRPEISPYTLPSVALYFVGGCTLYISPHLLSQSHTLEALYLDNPLHVLDVSDDAGHVLIHYLITGTYQSLRPINLSLQEELATEFSTSIRAYNAAKTYTLPSLADLATAEIERLGERLQFPLVFDLLREAYPNPDTDDVWLSSYLKNRLENFLKSGLMKPQGGEAVVPHKTVPISHILFKGMLELVRENAVSLREKIDGTFEEAIGDRPAFQPAPGFQVDKSVVKSNLTVGDPECDLFDSDDTWGYPSKNKKKNTPAKLALRLSEKIVSKDISTQDIAAQQQADREAEQAAKEAEERVAQEAAKAAEAAAIAQEDAEIARLVDKRDNSFLGLNKLGQQRLDLLQTKAKKRAEEQAARQAAIDAERATEEAERIAREAEEAAKEAREQEALETKKAAAIAMEEEELAYLIKKKARAFKGMMLESQEEKLMELQANATRRAQEKAVREAKEHAADEAKQAAREAEQAAKEEKRKGKKSKKGKKGKKSINNNMIDADPLPAQVEDFLVVKTQQEAKADDEENKDESRALHDQKTSQGEKKEKVSKTSEPVVHSSDGNPAIDAGQETKLDDDKKDMEEDGWSFWDFGGGKRNLAAPPPSRIPEETAIHEHTTKTPDEVHEEIVRN